MECSTILAEVQIPSTIKEVAVESLYEALQRVQDKRSRRGKQYPAAVVLTLLVLAKLAGEVKLKGVAEWVGWQAEMLAQQLPLYRGQVPCANTYRYVSDHIEVVELNSVLGEYFAEITSQARAEALRTACAGEGCATAQAELTHLALDGKNLRGACRHGRTAAVYTVGPYNATANFMWKQQTVLGKGQERKAALALLEPLALQGCVVSADALHTQPKWAEAVLERGGEYLLIAKGNQAELREAIALLFSQPPRPRLFPEGEARTVDKAHGRLEVRHLRVSRELREYLTPRWPQAAQVFQIERTITRRGKTTQEIVYGLTSLTAQQAPPAHLLTLVRQHWHIENRNHWRRDVTLGEDACRVTTGQVPQVLAALNNAVLAIGDFLQLPNLAAATRFFKARPQIALDLLLLPLAGLDPANFV
ncbi:MAG: ISAs1 family transposase [Caldilineaceae bacterium]